MADVGTFKLSRSYLVQLAFSIIDFISGAATKLTKQVWIKILKLGAQT